ncbi:hypothetical protein LCGC14_3055660 [marine sediment metagenome]|uniref:CRISPR type III-associated protein domain-containing protein n=1 Tax=marine sediment metagenome TaxID=412755 RepID=A0A0F8WKV0_9ZZZZ
MSLKAKNLWILELKATAVSTLYSGENKINSKRKRGQGNKLPTRRTVDGHAAISIYGVMRTFAEKIDREEGTCDIGKNAKGCGRCLTCNMFGNLGRKGRVLFEDLKSIKPFNQCTEFTIHPHKYILTNKKNKEAILRAKPSLASIFWVLRLSNLCHFRITSLFLFTFLHKLKVLRCRTRSFVILFTFLHKLYCLVYQR